MMTPSDQQLADQLTATLDRAQAQLAPDVTARLAEIRRQALSQQDERVTAGKRAAAFSLSSRYRAPQWAALAAMVALCAITLGVGHRLLPHPDSGSVLAIQEGPMADAWMEDPQMLADWEMLEAIGEDPDAT